jgi:peptide/nickel transport system ATP-binding protein
MSDVSRRPVVLDVKGLETVVRSGPRRIRVVKDVSFDLRSGECLAIVGESGSGKSMTALSLMRLLPAAATITAGTALLKGRDLLHVRDAEMRELRGAEIAMIYQDPMSSLDPLITVGKQIAEAIEAHQGRSWRSAWRQAVELLGAVGVPDARRRANDYPHQFSGGMRQRAMIAAAISCRPSVLVADEPTTALDVTVRAQILDLIQNLREQMEMAVILISHDLGVVAGVSDRIAVMYAGSIVETGPVDDVYAHPAHPYTQGLLASIPRLDRPPPPGRHLGAIPGRPPAAGENIDGCPFHERCPRVFTPCLTVNPSLELAAPAHLVACWWATSTAPAGQSLTTGQAEA